MVMDYYGVVATENEIAEIAGSTLEDGTSIAGMIKAANHFGFKVIKKEYATIKDLEDHVDKDIPVIVNWFLDDWGHYSVVVDVTKNNIILMDPALKKILIYVRKRILPIKKFLHVWFDFEGQMINNPKDLMIRLMLVLVPEKEKPEINEKSLIATEI